MVKVVSSTLVEVIVAMVILSIGFSIGLMIYFNILSGTGNIRSLKTQLLLKKISAETIQSQSFINEEFDVESITIYKTVSPYQNSEQVQVLKLEAVDVNEKSLGNTQQLVYIP